MFYKINLSLLLLFVFSSVHSQQYISSTVDTNFKTTTSTLSTNTNQLNNDYQKFWSFGGNIGLSFWNDGTDILIAPKAYYNISPMLITGFGLTYIYSDYKTNYNTYSSNSFGGSVFFAARPIEFIQLSAEYEGLQTNRNGNYNEEYWNNSIYLGISLVTGSVSFGIRYDILYNSDKSPYGSAVNPVIGFYF